MKWVVKLLVDEKCKLDGRWLFFRGLQTGYLCFIILLEICIDGIK